VVHRFNAYFLKDHTNSKTKYTDDDIVNMINFLIDNIFIEFGGRIFHQTIGIPMGTNCAPLLADLFLHSYKDKFVHDLLRKGEKTLAQSFNYKFRDMDDVLSLNNKNFSNVLHLIYPVELVVKDTTDSPNSASYLNLNLGRDINGTLTTKLHDKRDDFNFPIVNYPFLNSAIPSSSAQGVYMSQLIRYSRTCNSYQHFLHQSVLLTRKFLSQGFIKTRLRSTLKKCYPAGSINISLLLSRYL